MIWEVFFINICKIAFPKWELLAKNPENISKFKKNSKWRFLQEFSNPRAVRGFVRTNRTAGAVQRTEGVLRPPPCWGLLPGTGTETFSTGGSMAQRICMFFPIFITLLIIFEQERRKIQLSLSCAAMFYKLCSFCCCDMFTFPVGREAKHPFLGMTKWFNGLRR